MNVTVRLTDEMEQRLNEAAASQGLTVEEYVQRLVEMSVPTTPAPPPLTPEEWEAQWRAWAASHQPLTHPADDNRESIYAGRGE